MYIISQDKFANYYSKSKYDDNDFTEELFKKYQKKLSSGDKSKSLIWNSVLSENYVDVYDALEKNDKKKFKVILENFFQEKCIRGAEDGDLHKNFLINISHKYLLISAIIKLSEYLGIKKIFNPYQISKNYNSHDNIKILYSKICELIPIKSIPNVGCPYGMKVENGIINYRFIEAVYFNSEIKNFLVSQKSLLEKKLTILEIGAGSGLNILTTLSFLKNNIDTIYLVDLPEMLLLQEFFLKNSLSQEEFKRINFISNKDFKEIENIEFNIIINKDSLPEIKKSEAINYINFFGKQSDCYFFSLNQESNIAEQISVSALMQDNKNITKISRDLFLLRGGYVKEIFLSLN
ncbi:putative sugar O-methyltransferase [Alphaproteobacteria bacterium]|nr:putative sugar O-methyltransferase [Alphaproteobacteria bacterium]